MVRIKQQTFTAEEVEQRLANGERVRHDDRVANSSVLSYLRDTGRMDKAHELIADDDAEALANAVMTMTPTRRESYARRVADGNGYISGTYRHRAVSYFMGTLSLAFGDHRPPGELAHEMYEFEHALHTLIDSTCAAKLLDQPVREEHERLRMVYD
jgi:hypothetical protein